MKALLQNQVGLGLKLCKLDKHLCNMSVSIRLNIGYLLTSIVRIAQKLQRRQSEKVPSASADSNNVSFRHIVSKLLGLWVYN